MPSDPYADLRAIAYPGNPWNHTKSLAALLNVYDTDTEALSEICAMTDQFGPNMDYEVHSVARTALDRRPAS